MDSGFVFFPTLRKKTAVTVMAWTGAALAPVATGALCRREKIHSLMENI